MSISLEPGENADLLTMAGAVAVSEAVKEVTGKVTQIKWVNDVLYCGKKISGILAESAIGPSGAVEKLVLGIGINLYVKSFPPELKNAGALYIEKPPGEVRLMLIAKVLSCLEKLLSDGAIIDKYRELSCVIGRNVSLPDGEKRVCVVGIDDSGGLIVEGEGGKRTIKCGEISILVDKD